MKIAMTILILFFSINGFSKASKNKATRKPSSVQPIKCQFDNNGANKHDMSPNTPGMMGSFSNEYQFGGHTMSVYWNPGSPQDSQTSLSMTLDGINSVIYDVNLSGRNSPINVMTTNDSLFRLQCGVSN